MKFFTIKNQELCAEISLFGAELHRLIDLDTQRQYVWEGNEEYWTGHAPLLFPVVGSLWNGQCFIQGKACALKRHGYVRHRLWELVDHQTDSIVLAIQRDAVQEAAYPWEYQLRVRYALQERKLITQVWVENHEAQDTLYFQFGGHPSVVLPDFKPEGQYVQGYLRLLGKPAYMLRAGEQGCIEPEKQKVPWIEQDALPLWARQHNADKDEQLIAISVDTFANEALIFDQHSVEGIEVLDLQGNRVARFVSDLPVWLVWQPCGLHAPFLCCEPWQGLPDNIGFVGDISCRPYIKALPAGESWQGAWSMEV